MTLLKIGKRPARRYAAVIVGSSILLLATGVAVWQQGTWDTDAWATFVSVVVATLSVVYFVQSQRLEETRLFIDLFTTFNKRYDELNGMLGEIIAVDDGDPLTAQQRDCLIDYFNLCAEEYLFYSRGYIIPEAWDAWLSGMRFYYEHERIAVLWDAELGKGSYYRFPVEALRQTSSHRKSQSSGGRG